jgi:NADH:ubiquinone oxidoreductase subunit F (NADH-binding)
MLVTVLGAVRDPGVLEVGIGTPVSRLLDLAGASARQCGPCTFGLPAIADQVERLADGRGAGPGLLRRWLGQIDRRGGCAHPDGVVRLTILNRGGSGLGCIACPARPPGQ